MARSELSKAARAVAAKGGMALPNGKYPIRTRRELKAAIKLRHHSTEQYAKVRSHILKRAAALGIKLTAAQVASARPSTVVFACYEKACAPPPVGKGGSTNGGGRITLYRGEGDLSRPSYYPKAGPDALAGAWWTSDRKSAEQYANSSKGRVYQIEVNISEVEPRGARGNYVILNPEVRKRRVLSHPVITVAEARGDSKPVTRAEFQRLASIGQGKLDAMSANASPIKGLDDNWGRVKADSYTEATKSWGGATIDSHTGKALPQGANRFALTVKEKGGETVSVPENSTRAEFDAAMDRAKERFRPILEREGHHLGVFHDDDLGRIDIDPVLVVDRLRDVHTIGAATRAIGGAYNFKDGNGYWPPHVAEGGG